MPFITYEMSGRCAAPGGQCTSLEESWDLVTVVGGNKGKFLNDGRTFSLFLLSCQVNAY